MANMTPPAENTPETQTPLTSQQVLERVRRLGIVRAKDLSELGISPTHLQRLRERGLVLRSSRGIYLAADAETEERLSLAEVTRRAPGAVICLLSALDFHGLTTQIPHAVWIARGADFPRPPRMDWPPVHQVQMTGDALTEGVEEHTVLHTTVRIFSPAKTVADCFKFRNKIGLDVVLEALRDCWRKRRATMEEL